MLTRLKARLSSFRLGGKLLLLLSVGFFITFTGILAFYTVQRVTTAETERLHANLRTAQVLAGPLSTILPASDKNSAVLYAYMELLQRDSAVVAVVFVKDGTVIKSQQSTNYVDFPIEVLKSVSDRAYESGQDRILDREGFEHIAIPVVDSAERTIGAFGIAWSTEGLHEAVWRDALVQAGGISLICGCLLWLLAAAVRHLVTKPLRIIADVVEHATTDGHQHEDSGLVLDYEGREDEIGSLARALGKFQARSVEVQSLNKHFDAALDNMTQGLCLFDSAGCLLVHNQRFTSMFGAPLPGATAPTLLADQRIGQMLNPAHPDRGDGPDAGPCELPDGRVIQVSRQAIAGAGWVATYEDITERRRSRDQLSHMARHDALTGLPNRVKFREHMEHMLPRARRDDGTAVLYLDLDGFKSVNDTLGHPVGDELLRAVAARLRECTRETDLVARLGGDEFAIVQADAQQPTDATTLADRLVGALQEPFDLQGHHVAIGVSIGIVLANATSTPDGLLRNADIALYGAKAGGRGTWRFFEPGMDVQMQARRSMEADLRQALAAEQFKLFYQPLIEASTERLIGFEALLRWNHPTRGMVSPAEFIPLAEETGLIRGMGAWVLKQACADAAGWPPHVRVAVNLSPVQFTKGNLVRDVEQALAASELAAGRLELEITESVLLQDNDTTMGVLHRLRSLGVRISMDDFGTGYSSLSYLRRFPFDKIKIDQSFVRNSAADRGSVEIIRAVIGLGQALSMEVLAEGVETTEQLRMLQTEGCDALQGYLFSKPRPLADVPGIIAKYSPAGTGSDRAGGERAATSRLTLVRSRP